MKVINKKTNPSIRLAANKTLNPKHETLNKTQNPMSQIKKQFDVWTDFRFGNSKLFRI